MCIYRLLPYSFVDDIALLENDSTKAQRQLDKLEHEAKKVGLEINVQKTEKMRLNQSSNLSSTDPLVIKSQPIKIFDDFKYLGTLVLTTQDRQNVMSKSILDLHGQHWPNLSQYFIVGQTQLEDPSI